jgi:hypothetical protein
MKLYNIFFLKISRFAQTISQIEVFWNLIKSSSQSDQKSQFSSSMKKFIFNVLIFGLKVFISSYSGKQWEKLFIGLIRTLLSGYDLPYRIFKLYQWEAFSKVKFYRSRNVCLTDFMTFLFF